MRTKGIKTMIKGLTLGSALAFGLLLVGTTSVSAQYRDRDYRDNGQYDRGYDRNNDGQYDRVNRGQIRAAYQRGYQAGLQQARQQMSNRGYRNNTGYGNYGGYGNNSGYYGNGNRNGWGGGNSQLRQAYQNGFSRGYQDGMNRSRGSRNRTVFGIPY
jgi:hypothetical protein